MGGEHQEAEGFQRPAGQQKVDRVKGYLVRGQLDHLKVRKMQPKLVYLPLLVSLSEWDDIADGELGSTEF